MQLRTQINRGYADIVERIHDTQTEVLKAFYAYAQGNNWRVGEIENTEVSSAAASPPSKIASSKSSAV